MAEKSPFRIEIWDKTLTRIGMIGAPVDVKVYPRHNVQPTATITVRSDDPNVAKLLTEGARVTIGYGNDQPVGGVIDVLNGQGGPAGTVTATVMDDWRVLGDMLCWPVPTAAITAQSTAEYDTKIGPAETVVKYFAQRAITRLGLPITVSPDQGRGADIVIRARMQPLADMAFPLLDQAGIGVTIRQNGATGLVLDVYEPAWYPFALKPASGVVLDWEWARSAPKVTRAVAGDAGEGTARKFRQRVDNTAESTWGFKREVFVDATDATTDSELDAKADAAITDGAATTGLKLTLAETATFRYGDQLRVGDLVTTQLVPGAPAVTDVLREAPMVWNTEEGFTVEPSVGERTDDPNKTLGKAILAVARAVRTQRARR